MSLDTKVEDHHKLQFGENFKLATAYEGSKLRPFVTEQPCSGEGAVAADLIGDITYIRRSGRRRSNIENVPDRERRWLVYRDPIETGQYLDKVDKFRQIDDPTSQLIRRHNLAIGKGIDDTILGLDDDGAVDFGGILGSATEGKRPGATVELPSQYRTVHGSAGLTISKLRAARKRLGLSENDLSRVAPTMAITTNQHDDLLGIVETASANLNMLEQPHIVEGKVTRLMGFNFVEMNRLPIAGGIRQCPVWLKDMIVLGVWQDIKTNMWNDTHAANTPYAHADAVMDCVRVEDLGVHVCECQES
ncbi:phage capsid protein [Roseobacter sp. N2S]|uniref:phage capsid protein n=1 Tax=Roseobacter sp. N2S TaxID=2663844 RepID=UPI00285BF372|nr:phage capsid protein [Roseobacter sp. N2S]MDR6266542.1 hypothetical protein [Roseobacter sp. N2S]